MSTLGALATAFWAIALLSLTARLFRPILRRSLRRPEGVELIDAPSHEKAGGASEFGKPS
jgi:hypothetical protein